MLKALPDGLRGDIHWNYSMATLSQSSYTAKLGSEQRWRSRLSDKEVKLFKIPNYCASVRRQGVLTKVPIYGWLFPQKTAKGVYGSKTGNVNSSYREVILWTILKGLVGAIQQDLSLQGRVTGLQSPSALTPFLELVSFLLFLCHF